MDSYTVSITSTPSVSGTSGDVQIGGVAVFASENFRFETMQSAISALELTGTTISSTVRTTSATSPSGSETSFQTTSDLMHNHFHLEKTLDLKQLEWLHQI